MHADDQLWMGACGRGAGTGLGEQGLERLAGRDSGVASCSEFDLRSILCMHHAMPEW